MVPVTHRCHPYDASERAPDHHDPRNGGVAPGQISQRRGPPLSQIPIGRHNDLDNQMAEIIYKEAAAKLGKRWWK